MLPGIGALVNAPSAVASATNTHRHLQLFHALRATKAEIQSGLDQAELRGGVVVLAKALRDPRISKRRSELLVLFG